ncbi:hypothetical protein [Rhizobium sp. A37_96]
MAYIASFFAGAFLCNCLPHLTAGLQGTPFPTPFAKPRGVGNSSPLVNFLWGGFNLAVSLALGKIAGVELGVNGTCIAAAAGALVLGTYLSLHFGKVRSAAD